jgi:hypothetical protein
MHANISAYIYGSQEKSKLSYAKVRLAFKQNEKP